MSDPIETVPTTEVRAEGTGLERKGGRRIAWLDWITRKSTYKVRGDWRFDFNDISCTVVHFRMDDIVFVARKNWSRSNQGRFTAGSGYAFG